MKVCPHCGWPLMTESQLQTHIEIKHKDKHMRELNCIICGIKLKGDLDTWGYVGEEMCQACSDMLAQEMEQVGEFEQWYGMAPHRHVPLVNAAGNQVGHITEMVDYSDKPQDGHGWFEIEPGLWFRPDAETDGGSGVWEERG